MEKKLNPKPRSLPIPKEVNHYVLKNFGAEYYGSNDVAQKIRTLKLIELQLKTAGFNITWFALERRLKNMKSHYRRKMTDMSCNISSNVCWEYFDQLDRIFNETAADNNNSEIEQSPGEAPALLKVPVPLNTPASETNPVPEKTAAITSPLTLSSAAPSAAPVIEKRKYQEETRKDSEEVVAEPENLSLKRPKVIEFSRVDDLENHSNVKPPEPKRNSTPNWNISEQDLILKISESIRAIDEQRILLDRERVLLEVRRHELDLVGFELSQVLHKFTHQVSAGAN